MPLAKKQQGHRHIDRLLYVLLGIAEDDSQDTSHRLDAAHDALIVLSRRSPGLKKDAKKQAIERMLGKPKVEKAPE